MSHIRGQQDQDLHHEDGSHRSTPASVAGHVLESHERRIREHLAKHAALDAMLVTPEQLEDLGLTEAEVQALADEAEAGYDVDRITPRPRGERQ